MTEDYDLFAALEIALDNLAKKGYLATGLLTRDDGELVEITGSASRPRRVAQGVELSLH